MTYKIEKHLEDLPHKNGKLKHKIDWKKSIGCSFRYIFNDDEDFVKILDYDNKKGTFVVEYKNSKYNVSHSSMVNSNLQNVFHLINFKYNIYENIKDDKRDITIIDNKVERSNSNQLKKMYNCHCNRCNYEYWVIEGSINNGIGCPCCAGKVVVAGVNDIPTTDPWMIPYFQGGKEEAKLYTSHSSKTIYPICPDCGRIKDKSMNIYTIKNTGSIGCKCSDGISYPEKFFMSILDQLNIRYKWQLNKKDFEWCGKYKYDFYLIDYNYIAEIHGEQHYRNCSFGKIYKEQIEIDNNKKNLAINNGINKYIEIDCRHSNIEWIVNSINSSILYDMFDFSSVDFNKCNEFATKNIIKTVCLYYENHKPILTKDLSKIFNIQKTTIISYLHKGDKLGWCNYDAKESHKYGSAYSGKNNTKKTDIYKDNVFIVSYNSLKDMEEKSLEDLGVKLLASSASRSFKENKLYKGYKIVVHPINYNDYEVIKQ